MGVQNACPTLLKSDTLCVLWHGATPPPVCCSQPFPPTRAKQRSSDAAFGL